MFNYKSVKEEQQLLELRKSNERLKALQAKTEADIVYLAMMTDIELDEEDGEVEQEV
ncbi:MAG: hypothetical protein LUD81_04785 [Clostridiales bacterium]|nr:hypothetical protein [Clostridiales bacterium]